MSGKASPPLPSMLQVTSHSATPPLFDPETESVVACAMPEGCVQSRRPRPAGHVTQRASLECISGGASRAESRNGTPGRETLATGLDEMLVVDLAAFAERAAVGVPTRLSVCRHGDLAQQSARARAASQETREFLRPVARKLPARCDDTGHDERPRQGASSLGQGAAREMCDRARGAWVAPHWVSDGVTASRAPHSILHCNSASDGSSAVYSSYRTRLLIRPVCFGVFDATQEESPRPRVLAWLGRGKLEGDGNWEIAAPCAACMRYTLWSHTVPCVPDKVLHADLTYLDAHCLMTCSSAAALAFHQYFSPPLPNHLHVFNFLSTPEVLIRVLSGGRAPEVTWTEPR